MAHYGYRTGIFLGLAIAGIGALMFYPAAAESEEADSLTFGAALRHRHMRLGVLAIFLYVGAEVAIGSFLINYISLPHIGNMTVATAAVYVSLYWGGAMLGRFAGAALLTKANPRTVLGGCAVAASLLLLAGMFSHGYVAVLAVVAIGLFNSVMFPNIFTLGIGGMGVLTGKASSLQIMAIVGGAIVPLLQGVLADRIGVQLSFVLPLLCYAFVAYYGYRGSRLDGVESAAGAARPQFIPH
ncbi:MFS transporter [Pseudoduganella aquatica]|uniref:hypothetical protein n=1 Tax=Pseudoduganella aquatica TaxID=2660641 RepID=UPI001E3737B6|nr:hypothetical protein [Pseudoduganella aquatica]